MTADRIIPSFSTILKTFILVFGVNALSFAGYRWPGINHLIFFILGILMMLMVWWKIEIAVLLLFIELFISPKGYLFSWNVSGYVVSERYLIFVFVVVAWIISIFRQRNIPFLKSRFVWSYAGVVIALAYGVIRGLLSHPAQLVFADANGYLALALIPIAYDTFRNQQRLTSLFKTMFLMIASQAIIAVLISATFSLLYYSPSLASATTVDEFQLTGQILGTTPENAKLAQTIRLTPEQLSFRSSDPGADSKPLMYRWLKDTGQAEVAYLGNRFFRVFSANFIFTLPLFFLLLSLLLREKDRSGQVKALCWSAAILLFIGFSFSRSLWLGAVVGLITFLALASKTEIKKILFGLAATLVFAVLIFAVLPPVRHAVVDRFSGIIHPARDLAATDRMNLLTSVRDQIKQHPWVGSGFGTSIVFKALIPGTAMVEYVRVYLFEWTYLDIWAKIGAVGLILVLTFLFSATANLIVRSKKTGGDSFLARAFAAGLVGFLALNLTTPYINHPLGLGLIAITTSVSGYLARLKANA